MFFRKSNECAGETLQILFQQFQRAAKLQHYSRVDGILTGGAPMNEASRVLIVFGDSFSKAFDDGDCQIPGSRRVLRYQAQVEVFHVTLCGDCAGARFGNNSRGSLGASQGSLKMQNGLHALGIGKDLIERRAAEQRIQNAHRMSPAEEQFMRVPGLRRCPGPRRCTLYTGHTDRRCAATDRALSLRAVRRWRRGDGRWRSRRRWD